MCVAIGAANTLVRDAVLPTRMAVVALVQVLHLMMEKRMKLALSKRHEEQKASVVGPVQRQPRKDVIQIFGWAVWSLRVALIKKANGKEERFVSVDSEEEEPEQKEIGFLTDMTMRAAETILSDSCRKNWHNGFLSMHDRGCMMLIREEFCPFGLELMQKVAGLVTQGQAEDDRGRHEGCEGHDPERPKPVGKVVGSMQ